MSNDTTVKSEASVVLDIKALAQRIRDVDIFPGMTFAGEFSVISNDMRSVTSDLASHNRQWAHQLESIAEDMAECGCAGDHWDRGDSRDAVISDLEELLRRMSTKSTPANGRGTHDDNRR